MALVSDAGEINNDADIMRLPGRQVLDIRVVRELSHRSDGRGLSRAATHVACLAGCGYLVWLAAGSWLRVPAMALLGTTIVTMFAPMHECVHKTAFRSRWLNESVGWIAGALCFYNFTYYRRYHTWHHRFTQDAERDPELSSPKPHDLLGYVVHISGIPFWFNRPLELIALAVGRIEQYAFVAPSARPGIVWSVRAQLGLYAALAVVSIASSSTFLLWYWLVPAILGQPLLRALLIVEHTGCSEDTNGLTNTRTTLASFPIRLLMWNMPFHAEHHLYPSIPFYCLPQAHEQIRQNLAHVAPSYPAANHEVVQGLHRGRA
ncbi:MAG: fatty acid desaturase [Pirellulales bacterium]